MLAPPHGPAPLLPHVGPSRSLCSSNRRRFDSRSQSILWASNVFAPAALNRIMRPFCLCTKRRASATCPSTRRRSSSKLIAGAQHAPRTNNSGESGNTPQWPLEGPRCVFRVGSYLGALERNANRRAPIGSLQRPQLRTASQLMRHRRARQGPPRPAVRRLADDLDRDGATDGPAPTISGRASA